MKSALWAELRKIGTVKSQWIVAALAAAAIPLTSLLVVATGHLDVNATATSGAATGSAIGLLAYGMWAATIAAGEYTTQSIVVSLTTVSNRTRLYAAKVATAAGVAGIGGMVSAVTALMIVFAVVPPGTHRVGAPASLLIVVLAVVAVAAVGAASGMVTRSPTGSVAIIAFVLLAPQAAGGLLGRLEPWIVGASPATVITQIAGSTRVPPTQAFPAGAGWAAMTMILVAAAVTAAGAVVFQRRDG